MFLAAGTRVLRTTPAAAGWGPPPAGASPVRATTSRSAADRLSYKEDAGGSTPPSSTVAEVEVDDTPGRGPGESRFESGRSPHHAGDLAISGVSYALRAGSIPAPATMGRWRNWKRASLAQRRLRVRLPLGPPIADVAQLGEARRSDRRQCRFESDRQYRRSMSQLDVAQWERTGPGSRWLGVRISPSRPPMRGSATGTTPGPDPGDPRSNRGLAARRCSADGSACCAGGGSFFIRRFRVGVPAPATA